MREFFVSASEVKDTKFERNSQLIRLFERENHSCIFGHFAVFHQILALPTPYSSKKKRQANWSGSSLFRLL